MPNRYKAVVRVTEKIYGGPWVWNGATGECLSEGWSVEQHEEAFESINLIYEEIVRSVDWHRTMIEAGTFCLWAECDHDQYKPCGLGVKYALLNDESYGWVDDDNPLVGEMKQEVERRKRVHNAKG